MTPVQEGKKSVHVTQQQKYQQQWKGGEKGSPLASAKGFHPKGKRGKRGIPISGAASKNHITVIAHHDSPPTLSRSILQRVVVVALGRTRKTPDLTDGAQACNDSLQFYYLVQYQHLLIQQCVIIRPQNQKLFLQQYTTRFHYLARSIIKCPLALYYVLDCYFKICSLVVPTSVPGVLVFLGSLGPPQRIGHHSFTAPTWNGKGWGEDWSASLALYY